jgi:glycine/D-amino acid oxidase-like deaminating enzyme
VQRAYLVLATAATEAVLRANREMQCGEGATVALLDRNQLAVRFPWLNTTDLACATLGLKHEGWFDAYSLLRSVRTDAIEQGARYVRDEVTGIDIVGGRAAAGLQAETGSVPTTLSSRPVQLPVVSPHLPALRCPSNRASEQYS